MPRSVDTDFAQLVQFLQNYSLIGLAHADGYAENLKKGHKAYLVLLTLWSAIEHAAENGSISITGALLDKNSNSYHLLKEAISDFGSAYFCCIHGAYKPAHMALRSNIENFTRAMTGLHCPKALTTTSVYELFDLAKSHPPFNTEGTAYLNTLQQIYKELCKYSHSASLSHMAGICALQHFPTFEPPGFRCWADNAKRVMQNEISSFIAFCPSLYTDVHYKLREVIDIGLDPKIRLAILGGTH